MSHVACVAAQLTRNSRRHAKRGARGLFHGFAVTSFSGVTVNAASITSYLYLRDELMDKYNLDIRSAGAASGAITELLVAPFAIPSQVVSQVSCPSVNYCHTCTRNVSSLIVTSFAARENSAIGSKGTKQFWPDACSLQKYT